MIMSGTIIVRTGTYHNQMFENNSNLLFDAIKLAYDRDIRCPYKTTYFYFISQVEMGEEEIYGSLSRARKTKSIKTVSEKSNQIETETNKNLVDCTVSFYLDNRNTFIIEEKKKMPRSMSVRMLSEILNEYATKHDPNHSPLYGHKFEVTFDRYNESDVDEFLDSLKVLKKVEIKANSFENPYMEKELRDLQRKLMEMNADKTVITGKNVDKDSDFIRASANLSIDGHVDLKLIGDTENGERVTYTSNKNLDDSYTVENSDGIIEHFRSSITNIIRTVWKNHGKLRYLLTKSHRSFLECC